jgi:hypothetical protein
MHVVQGFASFRQGKHCAYDRVQAVIEQSEHTLEIRGRTHRGAEDVQMLPENTPHHQFR